MTDTAVLSTIAFKEETLAECLTEPMKALLMLHWQEIAPHQDLPLDPNYEGYQHLEDLGFLKCYILRDEGVIQGYAVFMVTPSLKYRTVIEAHADLLWLAPRLRGREIGPLFMEWCDARLAAAGVTVVRHAVERTYNFGSVLTRMGYEFEQHVYSRRLDKR